MAGVGPVLDDLDRYLQLLHQQDLSNPDVEEGGGPVARGEAHRGVAQDVGAAAVTGCVLAR